MVNPMTIWGHFLAICRLEYWLHASDSITEKSSRRLPCKLTGRLREKLVCCEVQAALRQRTLDHGGGRESESEQERDRVVVETSPRHSSASNGLAERAIWTLGERLRTLPYDTPNRYKTRITADSIICSWMVRYAWILCHEIRTWSRWHHTSSGQRMTEITRKRLVRLQNLSCSTSWHQNTVDCHPERDSINLTLRGTKGSG